MTTRKDIMYQHMIAFSGTDGLINDTSCKFLITEDDDSKENHIDLKNIITDQALKQGDYITIDGSIYMVFDTKKVNGSSYTLGTFREVLKITLESNLKDVYAIVDKVKGVYVQGQLITEVHDEYTFVIPKSTCNYTSLNIGTNLIVYAGGSYDAISIDDSKDGILTITGRFNEVYNPHVYTIALSETTKTLVETENYTIVPICTDNGGVISNPQVIYVSNDTSIATVSSLGVVSAVKAGSATITITYQNISATLALTVNAKPVTPVISYTYAFSQPITALKQYVTTTLTTGKTVNAVADSTLKIAYVFDSTGQTLISSNKVVVTVKSDSSISIKNVLVTTSTVIHLTVTDSVTGTKILDNQAITLTGM